jgi:hypothetical protein
MATSVRSGLDTPTPPARSVVVGREIALLARRPKYLPGESSQPSDAQPSHGANRKVAHPASCHSLRSRRRLRRGAPPGQRTALGVCAAGNRSASMGETATAGTRIRTANSRVRVRPGRAVGIDGQVSTRLMAASPAFLAICVASRFRGRWCLERRGVGPLAVARGRCSKLLDFIVTAARQT